ncbi:hypothetical protein Skr01_66060 [Sphaerisporangium krabiense]|uniref:DNA-binding SARP family transcriptional activator n=1 Tax=Sphaerisporangium krabiense TaxID=763782 RepID=A0A7W8YZP2_9ACTN|nr:AfsR/SARP family transcriptional regulator [Sphaerisporangium krabiense]MBB5624779.1 DNA-binding SARP family transcriptional activator [Sphaerisporangium krabiense]GII66521.1 hypothetical protein Skr01_66060 [Sphaerisporangium krabiense]
MRMQVLLAMLLVRADHVVSCERLVDAIWGDEPPASVGSQLRICTSGLRRLLRAHRLPGHIETHSSGYLIHVAEGTLDLHTFRHTMARARKALETGPLESAAALMRTALDLWRGPLCEGLESRPLTSIARKEEEERLLVAEEYFDVELQLGRHRRITGELTSFVAENPYRESGAAQLMIALQGSGRSADALEVYRQLRRRFSQHLGIEPAESLREVQRLILNGEGAARLLEESRSPLKAGVRM